MRRRAESLGIPVPESILVERISDLDDPRLDRWLESGPVVVKTTRSRIWHGSQGRGYPVHIVHDRGAVMRHAKELVGVTPLQVQRWVPGRGMGIDLLARHGEIVLLFAHDRIHEVPLVGGASSYRSSIAPPATLLQASTDLIRSYAWHGVAMVEFRVDEASGRFWLMEINGRFWGSLPLAVFAGADFPRALVELLVNDRSPPAFEPATGVYARNFSRDALWVKAVMLDHPSGPSRFTEELIPSLLQWGRVLTGKETWDGAKLEDPGPIAREVLSFARSELGGAWGRVRRAALLARSARASRARDLAGVRRVLVLCYGNICRSAYAGARLAELCQGSGVAVRSSGFHPEEARRTPERFLRAAADRGVDLSAHRSRRVGAEDLGWTDLIVLMDAKNHASLAALDPGSLAKVVWLGALDGGGSVEIEDPYDRSRAETDAILGRLDACLAELAARLRPRAGDAPYP